MTSQWPDNRDMITWIVISNWLDIDFIYSNIHSLLCKKPSILHDDVIKWKHFPYFWPFVRGIHLSSVISPHKGQWCTALMFPLIRTLINSWVNNQDAAGDLRCHRAHYDITVMSYIHKKEWRLCLWNMAVQITEYKTFFKMKKIRGKIKGKTWVIYKTWTKAILSISTYHQVSNISCTLEGIDIVDHSDVVGASPVGAAPTTSSFST